MNTTKKKLSLSLLVTFWTGASMSIGMGMYAIFQYFQHPGITIGALFKSHLLHILVLAIPTYIILCIVLHRVLINPLQRIFLHLYKIGKGKQEPLELQTNVEEVQGIIDGINIMIWQMRKHTQADEDGVKEDLPE